MDRGIKLSHQIRMKVLVEVHDPENIQLRTHLHSFSQVGWILLHIGKVIGADINIEILLRFDHIKIDCPLKTVPKRTVDKIGLLILLIGIVPTLLPELLGSHLSHELGLRLGLLRSTLGRLLR